MIEQKTENTIDQKNDQKTENKIDQINKEIVSKETMLEAAVYFGHRTSQWHPAMKHYILTSKKGTHVIDIQKTKRALEFAYSLINRFVSKGADVIFVGTKKQAKETIRKNALRTNSAYVSERWLGGTLTNNRTIFTRVKRMFDLERMEQNDFEGYTKKEGVLFSKELAKLQRNLSGIKNMKRRPSIMISADPKGDLIAIKEAKKLGIKVFGIVDTNIDPSIVDIAIPANDDSVKSIDLIITILADAIVAAKNGKQEYAFKPNSEINLPDELKREFKKRNTRRFNTNHSGPRKFNSDDIKRPEVSKPELNKIETNKIETNKIEIKKPAAQSKVDVKPEIQKTQKTNSKFSKENLESTKVIDLKEMAKKAHIEGYSKMKKDELVKKLVKNK